jgi:non-specific serine/threonine protein kinase/serine/threonine-protein kinase
MGEVWLAEQTSPVHRQVAIKVIKAGMDTAQVVRRFEAERQALALMSHPSIAQVFDGGATPEGRPFFAMEYVPGEPITSYCVRRRLSIQQRIDLFLEVCDGVQHAHQKGIIHRDLKPSNILVTERDNRPVPKIIDFGVAKATTQPLTERTLYTELGSLIGTPEYMSPEQAEMSGLDVDTRTDVYALGVILYELLTGVLPFDSKHLRDKPLDEIRRTIRDVDPPRPSTRLTSIARALGHTATSARILTTPGELRGDLDWITMKALEKDRTRRYGSASDLAADLRRHLEDLPVLASPPSTAYRTAKFVRRHRGGVAVSIGSLVLLIVFAVMMAVQARRIARERDRANQVSNFLIDLFKVPDPGEARGNTLTAREVLDKGAKEIERRSGIDSAVRAQLTETISTTYEGLGLYAVAQAQLERAVNARRQLFGPEAPETLRAVAALARVHVRRQQYDQALQLYQQATEIGRRVLGPDHPEYLAAMQDLGWLIAQRGQHAAGEKIVRDTLVRERQLLGNDDPQTLTGIGRLADVLDWAGRREEREVLLREQWEGLRRLRGSDHPDTLTAERMIAATLEEGGHLEEAERLEREVLDVSRRIFGREHPRTAGAANSLGMTLQAEKRFAEAEKLIEEAIDIHTRTLGAEADNTLLVKNNLGTLYLDSRRDRDAAKVFEELLPVSRRVRGPEHMRTLMVMNNLALAYGRQRRVRDATELLTTTIDIARRVLRPGHPLTAVFMVTMAEIHALNNDVEAALKWLGEAVAGGYRDAEQIASDQDLSTLRTDSRFTALLERVRGANTPTGKS